MDKASSLALFRLAAGSRGLKTRLALPEDTYHVITHVTVHGQVALHYA